MRVATKQQDFTGHLNFLCSFYFSLREGLRFRSEPVHAVCGEFVQGH